MKPFLLLQSRPEDEASDNEYEGFLQATKLAEHELHRLRVDMTPLGAIDLDRFSGVIVGGGPFNVSDSVAKKSDVQTRVEAELLQLLDELVAKDFPFFGACFGIGILGLHQGVKVTRMYGEAVGPVSIALTDEARADPLFEGVPDVFEAIVGHKEACDVLAPGAVHLASSATCPIQMFRIKQNLYATQFHPELTMPGLKVRVSVYRDAGYFPPEDGEMILEQASRADLSKAPNVLENFVRRYKQAI